MVHPKRVLVLVSSNQAYSRGCLRGIAAYARVRRHWHLVHLERGPAEPLAEAATRWKGEGILARLGNEQDAADAALSIPIVDLQGTCQPPRTASVGTDHRHAARLAADHLFEKGLTNLAFCGCPGSAFSDRLGHAFADSLRQRGIETHLWRPTAGKAQADTEGSESRYRAHLVELCPWIDSLPKPVGILAASDVRGRQIIDACQASGVNVPEQVAVVGIDNDEVICEMSDPPLSSVATDSHRIGFEAAALLDRLMAGEAIPSAGPVLIPPKQVEARLSSDVLALDDEKLANVVRYIREHACQGINVADVSRHCRISRSTLERRFARHFGYGPKEQILRARFEHVKALLAETDYELREVARLTGFSTTAHLVTSFKGHTGMTPGQFRQAGAGPTRRRNRKDGVHESPLPDPHPG